jgi:hypothetical protein
MDRVGKPQHFSGVPEPNLAGMAAVYEQLYRATGRVIASVRFGDSPSSHPKGLNSEYVVFEFTDGTSLELVIGVNGTTLAAKYPKFRVSDVHARFSAYHRTSPE